MSLEQIEKKYTLRLALITLFVFAALLVTLYLAQQSQETRKLAKQPFAPYVAISAPFDGQEVTGATNINASILNEVEVSAVEFYVDNKQKAVVARSPYAYTWDTSSESAGEHTITVRALDNKGGVGVRTIVVSKN